VVIKLNCVIPSPKYWTIEWDGSNMCGDGGSELEVEDNLN